MLAGMVACRGFLKHLAFISEAPENTLRATLVARSIRTTRNMTCPNLFHGKLLSVGERKKVLSNMVCNILHEAPRLLEEALLGFLVEVGARGVRTTAPHATHHSIKLFTSGLLEMPWVGGVVACLVTRMVMATLRVTHHGFPEHLQLLYRCRLCHGAVEMASKIVSATHVALLRLCACGIEKIALINDALAGGFKLWARSKAVPILFAFCAACFDLF
mmetsp:Transcript_108600/g.197722  ORF Transcript_108600/g.197722 Transcript_108600/m.197722 type:complete len:217 (+) Transcript_108600:530-1180(+)